MAQGLLAIINIYGSVLAVMLWCPIYGVGEALLSWIWPDWKIWRQNQVPDSEMRAGAGALWLIYFLGGTYLGARLLNTSDAPISEGNILGNAPHGQIILVVVALVVGVLPICWGLAALKAWIERRSR